MSEKERPEAKLVEAAATVAGAGLSMAGASSGLGVAAGTVGMVGGLAGAANALYGAWHAWQDERIRQLLQEAYFENAADEGFAAHIAALLRDPRVRRVILESVRTALESVADEVLSAIAALMREYERAGKEPDAAFRGLCRVLQELSAEEYASLRGLFQRASADSQLLDSLHVSFVRAVSETTRAQRVVAAGAKAENTLYQVTVDECDPRHFPRLCHLMYVHNIGNALGWSAVALSGEDVYDEVRLDPAVVRWVARFLAK